MRRITVAGALWVGISLSGLGVVLAAADSISGRVVDQYGTGVSGASVDIGGKSTTSGRGGNFTIEGLEDGSYKWSVRADDSKGGGSVQVADSRLDPSVLTITIEPKVQKFKGKVVDRDGEGQVAATVEVGKCGTAITNNRGEFTVQCEPGQYLAMVTVEGKEPARQGVTLRNGKVSPEIVIY